MHPECPAAGPSPNASWPFEVQFGCVLQAQHHWLGGHALLGLVAMGRHDSAPVDAGVVKKAVRPHRFAPPRHALGTLAIGSAINRSIEIRARLFRRASPRSSFANSAAIQDAGAGANFCPKDESRPELAKFLKGLREVVECK